MRVAVPSQYVLVSTIMKDKIRDSIALKVLMQMNCKLGGALWRIENPVRELCHGIQVLN